MRAVHLVCVHDQDCFIETVNIRYPLFAGTNKDAVSPLIPLTFAAVYDAERAAAPGVKVRVHMYKQPVRPHVGTALRPHVWPFGLHLLPLSPYSQTGSQSPEDQQCVRCLSVSGKHSNRAPFARISHSSGFQGQATNTNLLDVLLPSKDLILPLKHFNHRILSIDISHCHSPSPNLPKDFYM